MTGATVVPERHHVRPVTPDERTDAPAVETEIATNVGMPDRANAPVSVVAERFLRAIVAVVPMELLEEVHLFSPLRQGVTETGIAVVAAREVVSVPVEEHPQEAAEFAFDADASVDSPYADDAVVAVAAPIRRHTVYTARYRLVIKGAERGKWEADVVAEAEAPLITVEMVVRGVQRRAGEDSAITRFSAAQIAHALRHESSGVAGPT